MAAGSSLPPFQKAVAKRLPLIDARHEAALRLFNGFTEGCPDLVVDLYAATLVVHNYADPPEHGLPLVNEILDDLRAQFPWLRAGILKTRNSRSAEEKRGLLLFGTQADRRICEHGTWYAIDLTLNRDASFYLDTRALRSWAMTHLKGRTVLNTFAYTGSLGVAALAGGASRVVQLDRSPAFLNLARGSYALNGFPIHKRDFMTGDFWMQVGRMKRAGELFDCVFIDPPLFATSARGVVDQVHHSGRLINKVRPLIQDGGHLVAVNNALSVSGKDYLSTLESLCADGYLRIAELIPVPQDLIGYGGNPAGSYLTDPSPFNHPTKIAVLEVKRNHTNRHGGAG